MTRPDTLILKIEAMKKDLRIQIMHCKSSLTSAKRVEDDKDYDEYATALEKSNVELLENLITQGLIVLESIVWKEEAK